MAQLETTYLGLKLRNPIVVSSSGLTSDLEKIKTLEKNGAGAIVLKSLFEEQIQFEAKSLTQDSDYPEARDYVKYYTRNNSVNDYLGLIKAAKKAVSIPVIASINAVSAEEWVNFAKDIEKAGADALEVNVFVMPTDKNASAESYEQVYFDLAKKLKTILTIPFAFKLGRYFSNLVGFVERLNAAEVPGVVLFNRFYEPDFDIDRMEIKAAEVFSTPAEIRNTLRWVGIVSSKVERIDVAASTGVHDGAAAVKQLLAGAQVVQICSVLYKKGLGQVGKIVDELEQWMDDKGYDSVDEIRGKMSYAKIKSPHIYERAQFMKYFSSID